MTRRASSDPPDQRTTEVVALGKFWAEFSTGDFGAASEDETVPAKRLPTRRGEIFKIVVGRPSTPPLREEEDALFELVDILDGAIATEHEAKVALKRRGHEKWLLTLLVIGAVFAFPYELLLSFVPRLIALLSLP